MSRLCCAPFATFTFCPDRHVSPLLLSHPSKGCELICMTQRLSHTNKHRTNWLCCATYQLPRQSEQPQRFLFVYGRTARCVSSTRKYITVYYISIMRSLQWRTEVNDNKQLWWWWYTQRKVVWFLIYTMKHSATHSSCTNLLCSYFTMNTCKVFLYYLAEYGTLWSSVFEAYLCLCSQSWTSSLCPPGGGWQKMQMKRNVIGNVEFSSPQFLVPLILCTPKMNSSWLVKLEVWRSPRGLQQTLVLTL